MKPIIIAAALFTIVLTPRPIVGDLSPRGSAGSQPIPIPTQPAN